MKTGQKVSLKSTIISSIVCLLAAKIISIPAGFATSNILAITFGALILARPALLEIAGPRLQACKVSTARNR
jgi:hypothetical protein